MWFCVNDETGIELVELAMPKIEVNDDFLEGQTGEKTDIASSGERATHVYREGISFVVGAEGSCSSLGREETG